MDEFQSPELTRKIHMNFSSEGQTIYKNPIIR